MAVITWEPSQKDAVLKRFATLEQKPPAGVKVLGVWVDIHGGRVFELVDWGNVNEPKAFIQVANTWNDLCKVEHIAVMSAEEMAKLDTGFRLPQIYSEVVRKK